MMERAIGAIVVAEGYYYLIDAWAVEGDPTMLIRITALILYLEEIQARDRP